MQELSPRNKLVLDAIGDEPIRALAIRQKIYESPCGPWLQKSILYRHLSELRKLGLVDSEKGLWFRK